MRVPVWSSLGNYFIRQLEREYIVKTLLNYISYILRNVTNAPNVGAIVGTLVSLCIIIALVAFIIYKRKMTNFIGSSAQPGEKPTSYLIEAINSNLLHNLLN